MRYVRDERAKTVEPAMFQLVFDAQGLRFALMSVSFVLEWNISFGFTHVISDMMSV